MKKKIIALWGVANVGKSFTISNVYDSLAAKFTITKSEHAIFGKDIRIVLTINGIRIGIESQGDPNSRLEKSLKLFVKLGCEIIICCTRTWGSTVDQVIKLEKNYEIIWFKQERELRGSAYEPSNKFMAEKIITEVTELINT